MITIFSSVHPSIHLPICLSVCRSSHLHMHFWNLIATYPIYFCLYINEMGTPTWTWVDMHLWRKASHLEMKHHEFPPLSMLKFWNSIIMCIPCSWSLSHCESCVPLHYDMQQIMFVFPQMCIFSGSYNASSLLSFHDDPLVW